MPILVQGNLEEGENPKILVNQVVKLADAERNFSSELRIRIHDGEVTRDRMTALRDVLCRHLGDCRVFLHITIRGESETVLAVEGVRGVDANEELRRDVDALFGRPVAECGF